MKTSIVKLFSIQLLILFALVISLNSTVNAQLDSKKIDVGEELSISSKILNEDRQILVSRTKVKGNTGKHLPVLYVLDGGAHFLYTTGIVNYLSGQRIIPPMLVVAIKNINRNKDFTPIAVDAIPESGGAEKFHAFIEKELIPFIEKKYYTSDYRVLIGHSLGGTFATYSLLMNPNVFDSYISISPYLQCADNLLVKKTNEHLKSVYESNKFLYMTLGDEPDYIPTHQKFLGILKEKSPKNLDYKYVVMDEENHGTTPLLSIYHGLENIFGDWKLPKEAYLKGLPFIDKYYAQLSDKYGMDIALDENTINLLGYTFMQKKEYELAIETLSENTERYPKSANVYDSLGDAYKAVGKLDKAKDNYMKAVKLAKKQNHQFLKTYEANLQSVMEK